MKRRVIDRRKPVARAWRRGGSAARWHAGFFPVRAQWHGAALRARHRAPVAGHGGAMRRMPGLTLLEILIALFILQLVIGPLYLVFSGSRKTMVAARELGIAMGLASSYLAALRQMPGSRLVDLPPTRDTDLTGDLGIERLGVASAPAGFTRRVAMARVDPGRATGGPYVRVTVEINWENVNRQPGSYAIHSLLAAEPAP